MPQRRAASRRPMLGGDDRVSFELPSADADEMAALLSMTSLNPTTLLLNRTQDTQQGEADEEYSNWRERFPNAVYHFDGIEQRLRGKRIAVFLDYDGTLTPIVRNPDKAFMSDDMRCTVRDIASQFPTAIISGRGVEKVQRFVKLDELYYAGSHGLDIREPTMETHNGSDTRTHTHLQPAAELRPLIDAVYDQLHVAVQHIHGASVEHNNFCVSVHFRNCHEDSWDEIKSIVKETVAAYKPLLKSARGRKVLEIRPGLDWGKGKAVEHFLKSWSYLDKDVVPIYLGDDRTDEDAFQFLKQREGNGIGILVSSTVKPTDASYTLKDPAEVLHFLRKLSSWGRSQAQDQ